MEASTTDTHLAQANDRSHTTQNNATSSNGHDNALLSRSNPFENPFYLAEQRLFRYTDLYLRGSFVLCVFIPVLMMVIYFGFIASNQYTSEVRAVLRAVDLTNATGAQTSSLSSNNGRPAVSSGAGLGQSAGGQGSGLSGLGNLSSFGRGNSIRTASKDAYLIQDYVKSSAVIQDLKTKIDLESYFRGKADFWARFPQDGNEQDFLNFWKSRIEASVEGPGGILIIRLRTFHPHDSRLILEKVLEASSEMINDLQRQVFAYGYERAKIEQDNAFVAYHRAQDDLQNYRSSHKILDPYSTLQASSQLLLTALSERVKVQSDIRFMKEMMSEKAPSVQALREKLRSLDEQIQKIQLELTGSGQDQKSLVEFLAQYEELELRRVLAERFLAASYDQVEKSRLRLEQQKIYVEPFIGPTQMASSDYPHRIMTPLIGGVFLFMLWGIQGLILLALRDQLI